MFELLGVDTDGTVVAWVDGVFYVLNRGIVVRIGG